MDLRQPDTLKAWPTVGWSLMHGLAHRISQHEAREILAGMQFMVTNLMGTVWPRVSQPVNLLLKVCDLLQPFCFCKAISELNAEQY